MTDSISAFRGGAVVVVVIFSLLAAACGGKDASAPQPTAVDSFEALLVGQLSLSSGEARCVKTRVEEVVGFQAAEEVVRGSANPTTQAQFDTILGACAFEGTSPSQTLVRTPGQPFTYGDDPELDQLWDQCASTGTDVCDQLFNRAAAGSEYEAFANSCGGRGIQVACAPGSSGTQPASSAKSNPSNYGDDPVLDALWDQCAGGDGQACTALAFQAPAGSTYAAFGQSCGNRPDDPSCPASG
jgi:hypothetical protein